MKLIHASVNVVICVSSFGNRFCGWNCAYMGASDGFACALFLQDLEFEEEGEHYLRCKKCMREVG